MADKLDGENERLNGLSEGEEEVEPVVEPKVVNLKDYRVG